VLCAISKLGYAQIETELSIISKKGKVMANRLVSVDTFVLTSNAQGKVSLKLPAGRFRVCLLSDDSAFALTNCQFFSLPFNTQGTFRKSFSFLNTNAIGTVRVAKEGNDLEFSSKPLKFITGMGQNDFVKLLPGVFSGSELTSQYNVRGGNYDENLIYVNGIEIYRPQLVRTGQQEGLGFINSDLIKDIDFYAGGFAAEYGDKLSSVLDVQYLEPDTQVSGSVSASFLGLNLSLNNKPSKGFSYVFGARYRANNYILNSLDATGQYRPIFYDVQTLLTFIPQRKNRTWQNWKIQYLGNIARNKFSFAPVQQTTKFGTINRPLELTIGFAGLETMNYTTATNALSVTYAPSITTKYTFTNSLFNSLENEYYTVEGAYNLGELDNNLGSNNFGQRKQTLGLGYFINHARNDLQSWVYNSSVKGSHKSRATKNIIEWGANYRQENFDDRVLEWKYNDSAEMNLNPFARSDDTVNVSSYLNTSAILQSNQFAGFIQQKRQVMKKVNGLLNYGLRFTHRSLGNRSFFSPRVRFTLSPYHTRNQNLADSLKDSLSRDMNLTFSAGYYYQPAFYREMRDLQGNLNTNLAPQKSIHLTAGVEYFFNMWGRKFKYSGDLYYKHFDDLIPYAIDNVRIRYFAVNSGRGYAAGMDNRIYGEFIKDLESWFNLSILTTKEKFTFTDDNGVQKETDWLRRQTDARVVSSIFFQDELPKRPDFRMSMTLNFVSGLPYYFLESNRFAATGNRIPGYQRVDIGFQKIIISQDTNIIKKQRKWGKNIKTAFVSLDVFNLLANNNIVAYNIIKDYANNYYGVPNYLTGRRINLRFYIGF